MKIKKISAWILIGTLTCAAPSPAYAGEAAEEIITENQIESLLEDPDTAADIILYVKDIIDQQDISDEEILSAIDTAEEQLGITLSEKEEDAVLNIAKKVKDLEINEEELRSEITGIYDKLKELGIGTEEVKGFLQRAVDFVKGLLE